ncbi:hypothetical protein [Pelagibius sp.]|uniref:hypothetical protein n=1 Tax=Pelagibius sp. TaxID=1931238 RepID=UPI003BAF9FAC
MRLNATWIASLVATFVAASAFAVGFGARTDSAAADMPAPLDGLVYAGEYVELSPLRQFKLATASYVNPKLYRTAEVAYIYDLSKFKGRPSPELISAMQDGRVWFGMASVDGETLHVDPASAEDLTAVMQLGGPQSQSIDALTGWIATYQDAADKAGAKIKLVSKHETLLGEAAGGVFVSWEPKEAVKQTEPRREERLDR